MKMRTRTMVLVGSALLSAGVVVATPAVISPTARAVASTALPETVMEACGKVEPDASFLIPKYDEWGTERALPSGDGEYGYPAGAPCQFWVTDFMLNRNSNTAVDPSNGQVTREPVRFSGNPFDLPSSPGRSIRPNNPEDCMRLEVDVLVYRKEPGFSTFKLLAYEQLRPLSWSEDQKLCAFTSPKVGVSAIAPAGNMLTIRIATRVKLRGTWQQAAGYASKLPPT